jgi:hypothetical protein
MANIEVIPQVIKVSSCEGLGVANDPCRNVIEYFLPTGEKIARIDPWKDKEQTE